MFDEILDKTHNNYDVNKKLNIHFFLNKNLLNYCIEINRYLQKKYGKLNLVSFSNTSIIYPHITMSMGYYRNPEELGQLLIQLEKIANELPEIILTPKNIEYLSFSTYSLKYLSLFFKEENELQLLKNNIHSRLEEIYSSKLEWNFLDARPHVTLAVFKKKHSYENITKIIEKPELKIDRIGISLAGSRGTCLGTIKEFYLNG